MRGSGGVLLAREGHEEKTAQARQARRRWRYGWPGAEGRGQRAMALSDVDSDSTCKQQSVQQQSSRQVGQKSPAASSQPASQPDKRQRERDERRCRALATKDAALTLALLHQLD